MSLKVLTWLMIMFAFGPSQPVQALDQTACTEAVTQTLASAPWPALDFYLDSGQPTWRLVGVSGELQTWKPDPHLGAVLDLVKVYYLGPKGDLHQTWALVGAQLPAYFGVHDEKSRQTYLDNGGTDAPFYLSLLLGAQSHEQVVRLFNRPGKYLLSLSVSGQFVSEQGIDWLDCASAECVLPRFYDDLYATIGADGVSNELIHIGIAPSHPMYGFLTWPVAIERVLNVCRAPVHFDFQWRHFYV